ncbi:MAG: hypothetical protein EXS08_12810 [Planctomycetes bacterium]|nr:hypothetical protein [Planctomycetota bacterium]
MNPIATILLCSTALLGPGDPPQADDNVLVTYDLRPVLPRWDSGNGWSQSLLVPPAASPHAELAQVHDELSYDEPVVFELQEVLTQILGDELRREGRELLVDGPLLTVLAPPALQEQVRAVLDALESALSATVPIRVDVLTLGEGTGESVPSGPVSDEEAAKLVTALTARGAKHASYTLELSPGRTATLDARRRVPFLFDYDVEIAQSMMIYAPVMTDALDGVRLVLRGTPGAGGIGLSVVLMHSELLGKIAMLPLKLEGLVNHIEGSEIKTINGPTGVQSPEVLVRGLSFDTFLADGKALALSMEAALGTAKSREVVLLRRVGGSMNPYVVRPIPRTSRTLIALDSELFRAPRMAAESGQFVEFDGQRQPALVARLDGEPSGFLLEWLKARFSIWRSLGPWFVMVTDPAWDKDAVAQLDRLVKTLRPAQSLSDLRVDLRSQGREPLYPVRLRVPVLDGSSVGFVLARGGTAITGYDVEVAQGASVPDPSVTTTFDGLSLALSIQGRAGTAKGSAEIYDAPIAYLETNYAVLGSIARPEPRILRFDERFELPEGRPGLVRIGSSSERAEQLALAVEISLAPLR